MSFDLSRVIGIRFRLSGDAKGGRVTYAMGPWIEFRPEDPSPAARRVCIRMEEVRTFAYDLP